MIKETAEWCRANPGKRAYIFSKHYEHAFNLFDTADIPDAKKSAGMRGYQFDNGAKLYFRHCENLQDARDYAGAEFHRLDFNLSDLPDTDVIQMLGTKTHYHDVYNAYRLIDALRGIQSTIWDANQRGMDEYRAMLHKAAIESIADRAATGTPYPIRNAPP